LELNLQARVKKSIASRSRLESRTIEGESPVDESHRSCGAVRE
jgi:hypothetical protein